MHGDACWALAVAAFAPKAVVIPCASFEDAAELVKAGKAAALAVPAAWPPLGTLLMDEALSVERALLFAIPGLVVASVPRVLPRTVARLFHHPATKPLLPKARVQPRELVPMSSNTAAAARAAETRGYCITNSACAAHFGLRIHQVLRSPRVMPFIIFVAA